MNNASRRIYMKPGLDQRTRGSAVMGARVTYQLTELIVLRPLGPHASNAGRQRFRSGTQGVTRRTPISGTTVSAKTLPLTTI